MNLHLAKYLDRYVGIILCYTLAALHLFREFRDEIARRGRRLFDVCVHQFVIVLGSERDPAGDEVEGHLP